MNLKFTVNLLFTKFICIYRVIVYNIFYRIYKKFSEFKHNSRRKNKGREYFNERKETYNNLFY